MKNTIQRVLSAIAATIILIASATLAAETKPGSFAEFDAKAKAGARLNVIFFGASLTWGANASDPAETSYRAMMRDRFEQHYPGAHFRDFAVALADYLTIVESTTTGLSSRLQLGEFRWALLHFATACS